MTRDPATNPCGTLHAEGRLCAEAEAVFISIDYRAIQVLAAGRR